MEEIGPVQLISIGFDRDANFEGKVIDELAKLESERTIRVLDVLFIARDTDSDETVVLEHPDAADMAASSGRCSGLEFDGEAAPSRRRRRGRRPPRVRVLAGRHPADGEPASARASRPGSS